MLTTMGITKAAFGSFLLHTHSHCCLGHFQAKPCKTLEDSPGSVVSQVNIYIYWLTDASSVEKFILTGIARTEKHLAQTK